MEYRFEEAQKLKFSVYDLDNDTASLGDDDFLGSIECTLGEVRLTDRSQSKSIFSWCLIVFLDTHIV